MLKTAFNAIIRLHSRPVTIKRPGSPDIYSPARVTPSNFFRFLEGPSATVIHGREFVIPIDTMTGSAAQTFSFSAVPTDGTFGLASSSAIIQFDYVAAQMQTAIRAITGLENVVVTGDFTAGFKVTFAGIQNPDYALLGTGIFNTLEDVDGDPVTITVGTDNTVWSPILKRGDKIIHDLYGNLAIDEIVEMPDIGGSAMGYRVRAE